MNLHHYRAILPASALLATLALPTLPRPILSDPILPDRSRHFAERVAQIDAPPPASAGLDRSEQIDLQTPATNVAVAGSQAADSRVVFQSYRDNNWEVYRANGDFSGQSNATANPAADIRPELSFNGQKIVFASNRTGNFEIFVMNWDGSGLTQLTNSPGVDSSPSFAPDGRIAFISNRDGNQEVYVMNGDGGGLMRVTNTSEHEYGPAFSIDGRMSWARASLTAPVGTAVIAKSDGSSPVGIRDLRYLGSPTWSQSGRYVAIDGDSTGDGWNEVWVIDVSEGYYGAIYSYDPREQFVDALTGGWAAGDAGVYIDRAEYGVIDQQVVKSRSYVEYWALAAAITTRVTSTGVDEGLNIRWNDTVAPSSRVKPRSEWYVDFPSGPQTNDWFKDDEVVSWTGTDGGPAGVMSYTIQYKIGANGAWSDWISTRETGIRFRSTAFGRKISFRSRAIDFAGNVEPWSTTANGDVSLTLYSWALYSQVSDNRNQPIQGVTATVNPAPINTSAPSDINGNQALYFATIPPDLPTTATYGNYTVTFAAKPGYVTLPESRMFYYYGPQGLRPYLWSHDNIVTNGSFENGLAGWQFDNYVNADVSESRLRNNNLGTRAAFLFYNTAISQTLFVSSELRKPTLSFVTKMFGPMYVYVSSDISQTLVYSGPEQYGGEQLNFQWVDMSPWLGMTVTISFRSGDSTNMLDDVSLSSWNTPVVSDVSVRLIRSRDVSTPVVISGTNFITTPVAFLDSMPLTEVTRISEEQISAVIPAGAPVGLHNLTVMNPGGQSGTLQRAIQVGDPVYLPIVEKND